MHPLRSIRRLALGAAVAGAVIAAVPALASASSSCFYNGFTKELSVTDGSGAQSLRIVASPAYITLDDGNGAPPIYCGGSGTIAQVKNTDQIDISGPITNATDGYILDESGGRLGPGATLESSGDSEIEVVANTDGGARGRLEVRGGPQRDLYMVGTTGFVDIGGDGDSDFSIQAGANEVKLAGAGGDDWLSGAGFGSVAPASTRLVLDGGGDNDTLIGGNASDQFLGGSGGDWLEAVDNHLDVISGGSDFDIAKVDRLFDVYIDGVELIHKF